MVDWLGAAYVLHVLLVVLGAIGFFRYWGRTRFWLPRYVHVLAAIGLAVGLACVAFMPPSAPIGKGQWAGLKKTLLVVSLPAVVYIFFVAYGGQRAAYERTHPSMLCQYCRGAEVVSGGRCANCGQTTA
jgi:peptidoglycan/LPS O-acetylase OafA/YrhL